MDSKYINATEGRLAQGLSSVINDVVNDDYLSRKIDKAVSDTRVYTGRVTKYFPYLHKSEVVLDIDDKAVICKNSLLFGNELLLLYTPTGDGGFSKKLNEKFIKPRGTLKACVVKISNTNEYLLLSYYLDGELVGVNPAKQGNMKLLLQSGANEYYIKFGEDGLQIVTNNEVDLHLREFANEELKEYDKKYYTIEEMDNKIDTLNENIDQVMGQFDENTPLKIIQKPKLILKEINKTNVSVLKIELNSFNENQEILIEGVKSAEHQIEDNIITIIFEYDKDIINVTINSLDTEDYLYKGCSMEIDLTK